MPKNTKPDVVVPDEADLLLSAKYKYFDDRVPTDLKQ